MADGVPLHKTENSVNLDEGNQEEFHNTNQLMQWMACVSATLSMVATGTVFGWITTCLEQLKKDGYAPFTIDDDQSSWIVSVTVIGITAGSFLAVWLSEIYGRKSCLLISSIFYILGWIMVLCAQDVTLLYGARVVLGVGVGMSYTTNPMYISEVSDTNIRGALCTLITVNVFTGSLLTCCIGPYVSYQFLCGVLISIPIMFIATFLWFPETAYYLVQKENRREDALKSIAFFKGYKLKNIANSQYLQRELDLVVKNIGEHEAISLKVRLQELCKPNNRWALMIVLCLIVGQQLSGNFSTMQYLSSLFQKAKVGINPDVAMIIVFAVGLVSATGSTFTVEKAGRRPLLIISSVLSVVTLGSLAVYLLLNKKGIDVSSVNPLPVVAVIAFQTAYQLGLGTIPNALIGELFPTHVKSIAGAIVTIFDGLLGFVVAKLYQVISYKLGADTVYFFFAGSCFILAFFAFFCVPETKKKTFLEIQKMLEGEQCSVCGMYKSAGKKDVVSVS